MSKTAASTVGTPYHATAAERITGTELRLGRKIWASSELPDDLSRALWWKKRRWYFAAEIENAGDNDSRFNHAYDEHEEAAERHRVLVDMLWQQRRMLRLSTACVTRTVALEALFSDTATSRAIERL